MTLLGIAVLLPLLIIAAVFLLAVRWYWPKISWRKVKDIAAIATEIATDERGGPEASKIQSIHELIPDSRFIDVDGAKLHYVQAGEGPDVVLLHGLGASVFSWRFLFPLLQTKFRVTAIDVAGFGASTKSRKLDYGLDAQTERIAKLLEIIGIREALLVGSSMGGTIALWLARLYPERYMKILTLAPATDPKRVKPIYTQLGIVAPILNKALGKQVMRQLLLNAIGHEKLITERVVEKYLEPFGDSETLRAFFAATRTLNDTRLPDSLRDVKAKTIVLWGARERVVRRKQMTELMGILPDAELFVNDVSGHHPMEDSPEWVAGHIERLYSL
jgi:pimeloyl-ACP methyl ester carboxylesterase